ncbi:MAG: UDP-2,3-diacylglucosamine diphosphatase [Bacteroidota bacterium]
MADKIYFASDFHLGVPDEQQSIERERCIIRWLDNIKQDAAEIYLVGDVFDFWFEYATVVPKGYTRILGKLAELRDVGIPIFFFTGNHDMWMFSYFETEMDIPIIREPITKKIGGKTFFIGHGDGLGPGDKGYKMIKKIFASKLCQWLFARLHPNFGIRLAKFWSGKSRDTNNKTPETFLGLDNEWLYLYANKKLDKTQIDYFVFGHRHLPLDLVLKNGKSRYLNLGEWINFNSYAVFDGKDLELKFFEKEPVQTRYQKFNSNHNF